MKKKKKVKVLLVDDEKVFAQTLSERLQTRNLDARAVFGGNEALEDIAKDEPDVMVLDLKMPDMDGMEVLRRVREKYPLIETIILSGHGTEAAREEAANLGAAEFLEKPIDTVKLIQKINGAFAGTSKSNKGMLYSYGDFTTILQHHFDLHDISLGENALGVKCFCRDDNQDQIGYLLAGIGRSSGWFDLNSFGAYPAGRSFESLGPPSHHIPNMKELPWIILVHATHVGCDSNYTLGLTDRYGMREQSPSCGLLANIISRHKQNKKKSVAELQDFEMNQAEKVLKPYLDEIVATDYPMASIADKLLDLGFEIFDGLLRDNVERALYIGGINVDYAPENPEKNFFVPKIAYIYENSKKTGVNFE
ncbi:MAG: response regulator [Desulfobulbaceae bacterium]|nr:response regulator [Desulfobulbaceae bacterium]